MPNSVYNTKANASIRYKITDEIEISYDVKGGWGSCRNSEIMLVVTIMVLVLMEMRGYTYTESRNPFVNVTNNVTTEPRGLLSLQNYS